MINAIIKNDNVRVDKIVEKHDEESKDEPKDYKKFFYVYDDAPDTALVPLTRSLLLV